MAHGAGFTVTNAGSPATRGTDPSPKRRAGRPAPAALPEHRRRRPPSQALPRVSADQPAGEVARRVLQARLQAVAYWLPLAAHRSGDDIEYVHQLRTSARRAMAALKFFKEFLPRAVRRDLRTTLRGIRRAADSARNWDILIDRVSRHDAVSRSEVVDRCREQLRRQRESVQPALVAVAAEFTAGVLARRIGDLLDGKKKPSGGRFKRRFGRQTRRMLKPVVKDFWQAAKADLSSDSALHRLRIRIKKLRYTLEIVAPAVDSASYREWKSTLCFWQEILGAINDRVTIKALVDEWMAQTDDADVRTFLEGMLVAEDQARDELRSIFAMVFSTWKRTSVSGAFLK